MADLKIDDIVLDPCCGTAGFLIAAMHTMLNMTDDENIKDSISKFYYQEIPYSILMEFYQAFRQSHLMPFYL